MMYFSICQGSKLEDVDKLMEEGVEKLLACGVPATCAWENEKNTALHVAVIGGHHEIVEMLLEHGLD